MEIAASGWKYVPRPLRAGQAEGTRLRDYIRKTKIRYFTPTGMTTIKKT